MNENKNVNETSNESIATTNSDGTSKRTTSINGLPLETVEAMKNTDLYKALHSGLTLSAGSKTRKYVTATKEFDERLAEVVLTLYMLKGEFGDSVMVNGVSHALAAYNIPAKLQDWLDLGRIFGSIEAMGCKKPVFESEKVSDGLQPVTFNAFFTSYNGNQENGAAQIKMTEGYRRRNKILEDVQYFVDGDWMAHVRETGAGIETCTLCALKFAGYKTEYFKGCEKSSSLELGSWLLSSDAQM